MCVDVCAHIRRSLSLFSSSSSSFFFSLQSMEMELLLDDITKPGAAGIDWGKVGRFAALVKREKDTG